MRNVGDDYAAAQAMKGLCETSRAGADFQHTRARGNKALKLEVVDVLVDGAQRESVKALPFACGELVEVGFDGRGIVGHKTLAAYRIALKLRHTRLSVTNGILP